MLFHSAHKAAHPEKYTIRDDIRKMYPVLEGIEQRYGPTQVHLQVYDGMLSTQMESQMQFRIV